MTAEARAIDNYGSGYTVGVHRGQRIVYDFSRAENFNAVFCGKSGSGKTHNIQKIIKDMPGRDGVTLHILDTKGDFGYQTFVENGHGANLREELFHEVSFSYVNGNCGINIFQFSTVPDAGGVYMAIREIIEVCKIFHAQFSSKMGVYLSLILKQVYANFGIVHEDPSTWQNKTPTLEDVMVEIDRITSILDERVGAPFWDAVQYLAAEFPEETADAMTPETLEKLHALIAESASIRANEPYFKGWKRPTLDSLRDVILMMIDSRLFSRPAMQRKQGMINRYSLDGLHEDHVRIILRVLLGQIFNMAKRETWRSGRYNPTVPSHIAVVDEGKSLLSLGGKEMNPAIQIATVGRGLGVGLFTGVQSPAHVLPDQMDNAALRMLLKTNESRHAAMKTTFGINPDMLKMLVPKRNALVNVGNGFTLVE